MRNLDFRYVAVLLSLAMSGQGPIGACACNETADTAAGYSAV